MMRHAIYMITPTLPGDDTPPDFELDRLQILQWLLGMKTQIEIRLYAIQQTTYLAWYNRELMVRGWVNFERRCLYLEDTVGMPQFALQYRQFVPLYQRLFIINIYDTLALLELTPETLEYDILRFSDRLWQYTEN